jgi:hypothetical protein
LLNEKVDRCWHGFRFFALTASHNYNSRSFDLNRQLILFFCIIWLCDLDHSILNQQMMLIIAWNCVKRQQLAILILVGGTSINVIYAYCLCWVKTLAKIVVASCSYKHVAYAKLPYNLSLLNPIGLTLVWNFGACSLKVLDSIFHCINFSGSIHIEWKKKFRF